MTASYTEARPMLGLVGEACACAFSHAADEAARHRERQQDIEDAWRVWDLEELVRLCVISRRQATDAYAEEQASLAG